jgi:hypothetical protein
MLTGIPESGGDARQMVAGARLLGQSVQDLLHTLPVGLEGLVVARRQAQQGARRLVHRLFVDLHVASRFQLAHVRGLDRCPKWQLGMDSNSIL